MGRAERVRNGRSGEEGSTLKEDGYDILIVPLPKLKYATALPPFLKFAGFHFLIFL